MGGRTRLIGLYFYASAAFEELAQNGPGIERASPKTR
jgi:hypothetical protein